MKAEQRGLGKSRAEVPQYSRNVPRNVLDLFRHAEMQVCALQDSSHQKPGSQVPRLQETGTNSLGTASQA